MCGISGFTSTSPYVFSETNLKDMTRALAHRGPDSEGYYFDSNIGLGHRRLSILDLSALGNQPFFSRNGQFVAVFNGEIYNFLELKSKLPFSLKSGSDTEVLVELFAILGPSILSELNGMFAFAIYDLRNKKLFVGRDRMGKKPLYYYRENGNFVFASELKSFLKLPILKDELQISSEAIGYFLHLGYIPEPFSIYQKIKKFPSGSFAVLDTETNGFEIRTFWTPEDKITNSTIKNEASAKSTLLQLLETSTKYRLIADVPCGSFLSGGIDSSLVTALASKVSNEKLKTFSIGFSDWDKNEANYAKSVAQYLNTEHHELYLSEKEAIEIFDELVNVYDEPFADSSAIPTLLVSRFASQTVKVALSGDGGDELFQGYGFYDWAERLSNPILNLAKAPIKNLLEASKNSRYQRVANLFSSFPKGHLYSHIYSQEQYYFSESEINEMLLAKAPDFDLINPNISANRHLFAREKQALNDLKFYLKDDLLVKVDRASMNYGLEVRNPLLDYRLVEFALNIDLTLKIENGATKHLLKQILFDFVPEKYFSRPKWGFSIPLNKWLKKDLHYLIEKYISPEKVKEAGIINPNFVYELLFNWKSGKDFLYNRVWQLIVLHRWYFERNEIR